MKKYLWQLAIVLIGAPGVVILVIGAAGKWMLSANDIEVDDVIWGINYAKQSNEVFVPWVKAKFDTLYEERKKKSQVFAVGKRFNLITNRLQYRAEDGQTYDLSKDRQFSNTQFTVYFYNDPEGHKYYVY